MTIRLLKSINCSVKPSMKDTSNMQQLHGHATGFSRSFEMDDNIAFGEFWKSSQMNSIVRLLVPFLDIAFSFVSGIRKQAQPVELAVSVKDW